MKFGNQFSITNEIIKNMFFIILKINFTRGKKTFEKLR